MDGIAEKLSRLPPELRKEVEDFIDFLLERHVSSGDLPSVPRLFNGEEPPLPPTPVILADEIPFRPPGEIIPSFSDPLPRSTFSDSPEKVIEVPRRQHSSRPEKEKDILDWID